MKDQGPPAAIREVAFGSPEYRKACELRDALLRRPLGLELAAEDLTVEARQWHLIAELGDEVVGCLLLEPLADGKLKMRQVAVAIGLQHRGLGRALVVSAEALARERGMTTMLLHARESIVPFYERLGYHCVGEPFVEVTVAHRRMKKQL